MTDDLRFDELLREDAAALPPPADGEITPWRTAMDRILWGMGLTTITLNFLWLDVLLPAIGAVLLVLLLVVCYACNTANPMRTGSWIPFLD